MKRALLLLLLLPTMMNAADIERHWKSGCSPDNWAVKSAGIDITVNYYGMGAGIFHVRRANGTDIITPVSIAGGTGSFTVTHFTRTGFSGQCNDCTATESDYVATVGFVEGGPSLTASGGQLITQHTIGPASGCFGTTGETTTEVNIAITYTVGTVPTPTPSATPTPTPSATPTPSGTPPARCQWQITGSFHPQCITGTTGPHTIGLKKDGVLVGESVIPTGTNDVTLDFNGTDNSGTTIQLVVDGYGGEVHTVECHGDPPPGNWWHADAVLPGACNVTPTPAASPPPGSTPTPHPSLTPGPTRPPFTPPPGGSPGPSPGPPPSGTPTTVGVQNFNDFYEPVRKAVRDSGNDTAVQAQTKVPLPGVELDDSKMGEITTGTTESKDQATSLADGVTSATDTASSKVAALNTSGIGSECLISIHTTGWIHDKLQIDTFDINLCNFSVGIAIFRACLLWGMICTFFVLTLRTLVYDS